MGLLSSVSASDYPSKPVNILLGFEPGGTLYTQAEVLAEVLSETLQQNVFLQVKPGFGGGVATAMLSDSTNEGYILLFTPSFPLTDYPARLQVSYSLDDFTYISSLSADQHAFVTSAKAPFNTWDGFLNYARAQGEVLYASQNLTDRLIMQRIADIEGFSIRVIPVSGGAGMAPIVITGDVDIAFSGGTHSRFTDSGEMIVLATTGDKPSVFYPNIPTLAELGYDFGMQSIRLLLAPRNLPQEQLEILTNALEIVSQDHRFIQVTQDTIRQPLISLQGDELKQFLQQQQAKLIQLMNNHQDPAESDAIIRIQPR